MKLKDLLEAIVINGEGSYVELCALCHVEEETIIYTYDGCLIKAEALLEYLPSFILNKEVINYRSPKEFKFGLNSKNQIVECKKEIYIEY